MRAVCVLTAEMTPIGRHRPPYIGWIERMRTLIQQRRRLRIAAISLLRCLLAQHPSASNVPLSNHCSPDVTYPSFLSILYLSFVCFFQYVLYSVLSLFYLSLSLSFKIIFSPYPFTPKKVRSIFIINFF